jgi:hypothetical protein
MNMAPKRKRSSVAASAAVPPVLHETSILPPGSSLKPPAPKRQASRRGKIDTNPDHNADIVDGKTALRASPDADEEGEALAIEKINMGSKTPAKTSDAKNPVKDEDSDSPLSDLEPETHIPTPGKKQKKTPTKSSIAAKKGSDEIKAFKAEQAAKKAAETKVKKEEDEDEWDKRADPDGDDAAPEEDVDVMKKEAGRPPPVNSDYLPLSWKGRLGYVSILPMIDPRMLYVDYLIGMSKHLPPIFKSTSIHISHLSNRINPRASIPLKRPNSTRTCNQKPSRQEPARFYGTWTAICRRTMSSQRQRPPQDVEMEPQIRYQIHEAKLRDVPLCKPRRIRIQTCPFCKRSSCCGWESSN